MDMNEYHLEQDRVFFGAPGGGARAAGGGATAINIHIEKLVIVTSGAVPTNAEIGAEVRKGILPMLKQALEKRQ